MSIPVTAVTSRGCNRAFIACVLYRAYHFVTYAFSRKTTVHFPFPPDLVASWLEVALDDCMVGDLHDLLGGTELVRSDPRTYWKVPAQFFTWWKNNVERKAKYSLLCYATQSNDIPRALYSKTITALCSNIKRFFGRHVGSFWLGPVHVLPLPVVFPSHMPELLLPSDAFGENLSNSQMMSLMATNSSACSSNATDCDNIFQQSITHEVTPNSPPSLLSVAACLTPPMAGTSGRRRYQRRNTERSRVRNCSFPTTGKRVESRSLELPYLKPQEYESTADTGESAQKRSRKSFDTQSSKVSESISLTVASSPANHDMRVTGSKERYSESTCAYEPHYGRQNFTDESSNQFGDNPIVTKRRRIESDTSSDTSDRASSKHRFSDDSDHREDSVSCADSTGKNIVDAEPEAEYAISFVTNSFSTFYAMCNGLHLNRSILSRQVTDSNSQRNSETCTGRSTADLSKLQISVPPTSSTMSVRCYDPMTPRPGIVTVKESAIEHDCHPPDTDRQEIDGIRTPSPWKRQMIRNLAATTNPSNSAQSTVESASIVLCTGKRQANADDSNEPHDRSAGHTTVSRPQADLSPYDSCSSGWSPPVGSSNATYNTYNVSAATFASPSCLFPFHSLINLPGQLNHRSKIESKGTAKKSSIVVDLFNAKQQQCLSLRPPLLAFQRSKTDHQDSEFQSSEMSEIEEDPMDQARQSYSALVQPSLSRPASAPPSLSIHLKPADAGASPTQPIGLPIVGLIDLQSIPSSKWKIKSTHGTNQQVDLEISELALEKHGCEPIWFSQPMLRHRSRSADCSNFGAKSDLSDDVRTPITREKLSEKHATIPCRCDQGVKDITE